MLLSFISSLLCFKKNVLPKLTTNSGSGDTAIMVFYIRIIMILRTRVYAEASNEFQTLGSRGPNGQSSVSFIDPKTGVLFYALTNLNTIACWRPQRRFTVEQQGYVYMDNITMIFPNDLKVTFGY